MITKGVCLCSALSSAERFTDIANSLSSGKGLVILRSVIVTMSGFDSIAQTSLEKTLSEPIKPYCLNTIKDMSFFSQILLS